MNWISTQLPVTSTIQTLSQQLGAQSPFPLSLANILVQRKMDEFDKVKSFFVPDTSLLISPFEMKDMDKAVARILQAKKENQMILIYGDYDVDGTTAVTLMSLFLSDWGMCFEYYIPDRYKEGYGVSFAGVEYAISIGASLIISLDCGIKAHEKVKYAQLKGIDFIICDHHTPDQTLPEAVAVLDPLRTDCSYPFKDLTGCGVGLKLATALTHTFEAEGFPLPEPNYAPFDRFCDLVALSIACDIVPILGENRVITHHGLQKIRTNPAKGIQAIMELSKTERRWDITDLVFFVGPRINAAGRLGSAKDAVEVLLGKSGFLANLAHELHDSNDERKNIDTEMTADALKIIAADATYPKKTTTVLYKDTWHKGVIGIVASRLIEKYYRPTILFTKSEGKLVGSARSVQGFDLYQALAGCADLMVQFGGHKYAAGMTIQEADFPAFVERFEAVVSSTILAESKSPTLFLDHEISFQEISEKYIRLIRRMEPFGPENQEPVFLTPKVTVKDYSVIKDLHLRIILEHENIVFTAIGFNLAEKFHEINHHILDIAYHLNFNIWQGKQTIQLILKDIRSSI